MKKISVKSGIAASIALAGMLLIQGSNKPQFPRNYSLTEYSDGTVTVSHYPVVKWSLKGKAYSPMINDWIFWDENGDGKVDKMIDSRIKHFPSRVEYNSHRPLHSSIVYPTPRKESDLIIRNHPADQRFKEADEILRKLKQKTHISPADEVYDGFKRWGEPSTGM